MDLSVIIVNYKVPFFLEHCLYSVLKASSGIKTEIFVVDNHSEDGSKEYLEPLFPTVHFSWLPENIGFGKANNLAIPKTSGQFVLFLNPDCIVPEDCFTNCIAFMNKHADAGALGVRMIDGSGKFLPESKRGFPTVWSTSCKMVGLTNLFPNSEYFNSYYASSINEKTHAIVDVLAGAFMLIRYKCITQVKGFDPDFFMYGEDIDLSFRIQQAGWKNYYFGETTIVHFKGESTSKHSTHYRKHFFGAMNLFVKKHYKNKQLTSFLLTSAIHFSQLFYKIKPQTKNPTPSLNTAIVCSEREWTVLIRLIRFSKPTIQICGRISTSPEQLENSLGNISELDYLIKKYKINNLILSESTISFSNMIQIMETFSGKISFLLHAHHSKSIVGSHSRSIQGQVITSFSS